LIFASGEPLSADRILEVLREVPPDPPEPVCRETLLSVLQELQRDYAEGDSGVVLIQAGGGYRFHTRPEMAPWIRRLLGEESFGKLSGAALETLAVIAYAQPVSRAQIEAIRGVAAESVLAGLLEKGLVWVVGRSDAPGRPLLYGTTTRFLELFGLNSLEELPEKDELGELLRKLLQKEPLDA
jgi:segregation and condensation protein B